MMQASGPNAGSGNGRAGNAVLAGGLLVMAICCPAHADEPMFGYVNTTDLLPKGKRQIEQWATYRQGAAAGHYRLAEGRTEADIGLTSDVQLTAYLNYSDLDARIDAAAAAPARLQPAGRFSRARVDSATGELIWRLASPYLSPVGLAVLTDVTGGRDPLAAGIKLIGQKNFRDDTVVLAANLRIDLGQRESRPSATDSLALRSITPVELGLGASYRFRPNWSAAFELRARRKYLGGERVASTVYAGPTLHYGGQRWFMTLSALARMAGDFRAPSPGDRLNGLAYAAGRTRWDGLRMRVGRTY